MLAAKRLKDGGKSEITMKGAAVAGAGGDVESAAMPRWGGQSGEGFTSQGCSDGSNSPPTSPSSAVSTASLRESDDLPLIVWLMGNVALNSTLRKNVGPTAIPALVPLLTGRLLFCPVLFIAGFALYCPIFVCPPAALTTTSPSLIIPLCC